MDNRSENQKTCKELSQEEKDGTKYNITNIIQNSKLDVTNTVNRWLTKAQCEYGLTFLKHPKSDSMFSSDQIERIDQTINAMNAKIRNESWKS